MNSQPHPAESHLSDDQFAELLFGDPSTFVSAHLASCRQCAAEAANVRGAVTGFSQQSKLWAERHAATYPSLDTTVYPARMWAVRTAGFAVASLALVIAAGTNLARHHATASQQTTQTTAAPPISAATLKADNDLLSAIDGELRVSDSTQSDTRTERTKSSKRSISE